MPPLLRQLLRDFDDDWHLSPACVTTWASSSKPQRAPLQRQLLVYSCRGSPGGHISFTLLCVL